MHEFFAKTAFRKHHPKYWWDLWWPWIKLWLSSFWSSIGKSKSGVVYRPHLNPKDNKSTSKNGVQNINIPFHQLTHWTDIISLNSNWSARDWEREHKLITTSHFHQNHDTLMPGTITSLCLWREFRARLYFSRLTEFLFFVFRQFSGLYS
jgi:hypothetical protein